MLTAVPSHEWVLAEVVACFGSKEPGPFPERYLDRKTLGSLLMAFPGTGNKGVTSTSGSYVGLSGRSAQILQARRAQARRPRSARRDCRGWRRHGFRPRRLTVEPPHVDLLSSKRSMAQSPYGGSPTFLEEAWKTMTPVMVNRRT